jgi:hypothetical protein
MSLRKQGSFTEDKEFVEIGNSPSRFDTSSSQSECELDITSKE